jgi:hypothetical protein
VCGRRAGKPAARNEPLTKMRQTQDKKKLKSSVNTLLKCPIRLGRRQKAKT